MVKMMNNSSMSSTILLIIYFIINITLVVECLVPLSKTFKFTNHGKLSNGISTENNAQFRAFPRITNHPFQLCFYTTTTDSKTLFTLGLSVGGFSTSGAQAKSLRRWVWAANPTKPVGEHATLAFGTNGNLVLANTNGQVVWQTKTANKGVTDIKLLSNGNLVLLDKTGRFVWQSFDYPSDTLLNGQAILGDGSNKLASGSYSMAMKQAFHLTLFFHYKKFPPFIYHTSSWFVDSTEKVRFFADGKGFGLSYETIDHEQDEKNVWSRPGYDTTLSMLRLDRDGNLRVYTYNRKKNTWETPYKYFSSMVSECNLPEKCGVYGFCKNQTCVSCPSSKGLMAAPWSKECRREKIPRCNTSKRPEAVGYYQMVDVTSSSRSFNDGDFKVMTVDACKKICSKDCKCSGFFFRKNENSCLVATTEIFTLSADYIGRTEIGVIDPEADTYIKYIL